MDALIQFVKKQYLNLETYHRSGEGVQTPLWFSQEGETLYILTQAKSGKVKRIHRNPQVKVTPCRMNGTPLGTWTPAKVVELRDVNSRQKVERMLNRKYGLMRKVFSIGRRADEEINTVLAIQLTDPAELK
jgi:uncharacterized protein